MGTTILEAHHEERRCHLSRISLMDGVARATGRRLAWLTSMDSRQITLSNFVVQCGRLQIHFLYVLLLQ